MISTVADVADCNDMVRLLAEQQAALRRVAMLVAGGASPPEVFAAVAHEISCCLHVCHATVCRYETDGSFTVVASCDECAGLRLRVGDRLRLEGDNVALRVLRAGRAVRMDSHQNVPGPASARIRELGLSCGVGAPIVVDGTAWGVAIVGSSAAEPLPADTEARIGDFADLAASAIANAATRAELLASRARIVAAADDARRRLERDLHDGAQQRLVSLGLQLRMAEAAVPGHLTGLRHQLSEIAEGLTGVFMDLREISHGIHPAILSRGGLGPALKTLTHRSTVPASAEVAIDRRLPDAAEVAAYYVVAEALTNASKHAHASAVRVTAYADREWLCLCICDDGVGGADPRRGSGLIGVTDRVKALGGRVQIVSPLGNGTSVDIRIPIEDENNCSHTTDCRK